jgi:hypothetical protein
MDTRDLHEKGLKLRREIFGDEAVEQRTKAFGAFGEPLQNMINVCLWRHLEPACPAAQDKIACRDRDDGRDRPRERASRPPQRRADQRLHGG